MESIYGPLSDSCAKALSDKVYDKRKLAAVEIEKLVIEFNNKNNVTQIRKLIQVLATDFAASRDANRRKGGLIGLASTSLGLGKDSDKYINELIPPILTCLSDADQRVRYFACESLYNVVKVARTSVIPLFPDMFPALSRLITDPDQSVKDGSELLDRLLKDIVTECAQSFDLNKFIPFLRERIYIDNSFSRQYIISWISVLHVVPEINMVQYLTEILDGLFLMLNDPMEEIHRMCDTLMCQLLKSIKLDPSSVEIEATINILIGHAQSTNDLIQLTAINWIREFVIIFGSDMLPYASRIFTAILPSLACENDNKKNLRECALAVNKSMVELISCEKNKKEIIEKIDLPAVMEVFKQYLTHSSVQTKVEVLKWINHLYTELSHEMSSDSSNLFPVLLRTLSDDSDEVVLQSLSVLAEIINSANLNDSEDFNKTKYREFLKELLRSFCKDSRFLKNRGSLVIRKLCVFLNAEYIYRTFAEIIAEQENLNVKNTGTIIKSLNNILLTSCELYDLRTSLRNIDNENSVSLFICLYKSWVYCPVSTLALCLLAQNYKHVSNLVVLFGTLEIDVEILTELDKLVQLIESPIFASLRLTLVSRNNDSADAQHLANALFGLLMLMPQTEAFLLLKNRLQCVPNYWKKITDESSEEIEGESEIDFTELLEHFEKIQRLHNEQKLAQRKRSTSYEN